MRCYYEVVPKTSPEEIKYLIPLLVNFAVNLDIF